PLLETARTCKDLQHDGVGDGRQIALIDVVSQAQVDCASGLAEVFHPGRGVDENQISSTGSPAHGGSSRSPPHPMPCMANISSRVIGSGTSRRRAKSTASRLVLRR